MFRALAITIETFVDLIAIVVATPFAWMESKIRR
jgi:hypothetical protein